MSHTWGTFVGWKLIAIIMIPMPVILYIIDRSRYREMYIVSVRTPYKNEETAARTSDRLHVTHARDHHLRNLNLTYGVSIS